MKDQRINGNLEETVDLIHRLLGENSDFAMRRFMFLEHTRQPYYTLNISMIRILFDTHKVLYVRT